MRIVDAQATRDALPFARLVPALRQAFAEGCEVPPRQALRSATPTARPAPR